ncbi:MAG: PD40 domain-containing protein [Verrucomicrobia bacterium]|nr:PD40 domain-containing protein [Verrucomicrobiota bacterium]
MPNEPQQEEFKYWAFISYSHADDAWASWLHKGIETYEVPKHLIGKPSREGVVPKRAFPVFRDRDELPGSANLGDNLTRALRQSRYLVVVCSPNSVKSQWVDQEIRIFKSLGREDRVLCLIVGGEPNASARPELKLEEAFPTAVRYWVDSDRRITEIPTEPIAADGRPGKDGKANALLKVLSGILGVSFDDLKQRDAERREKRLRMVLAGAFSLILVFLFLGFQLMVSRNRAVESELETKAALKDAKEARFRADQQRDAAIISEGKAVAAEKIAKESEKKAVDALDEAKRARDAAVESEKVAQAARDEALLQEKRAVKSAEVARQEREKAVESEKAAQVARDAAQVARDAAVEREKEVRRAVSAADFSEATRMIMEGSEAKALASLARSLRYDPGNNASATRLMTMLSQRNWSLPKAEPFKHDAEVRHAAFSPDGTHVLTGSTNFARLWDTATGKLVGEPLRHGLAINSLAFSPDGKLALTASHDKTAQLWQVPGGGKAAAFKHNDWVYYAQFSPDGKRVVTASKDKSARVWEITGQQVTELALSGPVSFAAFSPDGTQVLTTSGSAGQVWDVASGKAVGEALKHEGGVYFAAFSPNGKLVATASGDKTARVWDAATGLAVADPIKHDHWVNYISFSGDSKLVATASSDRTARVWEAATGKAATPPLKHDGLVSVAVFSPNAKWLLTTSEDGTAKVWDVARGRLAAEPLRHLGAVYSGGFSPDGQFVVTASADQSARIWEIASGRPLLDPIKHENWVSAAAVSRDGKYLATASDDRTVKIWDVAAGRPLHDQPLRHDGRVNDVAFSPDGRFIISASEDRTARMWATATGKPVFAEPFKHESWVNSVALSQDGKFAVTASEDRTARLWSVETGKQLFEALRHDGVVKGAAFSSDGKLVVTASHDKSARVWSTVTGKQSFAPLKHNGEVNAAAFSPDGKKIVTASQDKTIRVWDALTGQPLTPPLAHDSAVSRAAFSPDGKWMLSASDKTLRVWDASGDRLITEPIVLTETIKAAGFSPDGQLMMAAAGNSTRLWDVMSGLPVAEPFTHDAMVRFAAFSPDGKFLASASQDNTARLWPLSYAGELPKWLNDLAESVGGYRLGESGAAQSMAQPWKQFAEARAGLEKAAANDPFAGWGRWYFSPRLARTVAPFSALKLNDYLARRMEEPGVGAMSQVLEVQPDNAVALARLSRATKDNDQADFYSRLAERYDPKNPDVLWVRAAVLQQLTNFNAALTVMEKALELDPRAKAEFGAAGAEFTAVNKDGQTSKGWLPRGWSDANAASPISVTYEKLTDAPQSDVAAVRMTASSTARGQAALRGPRFIARHNVRYTIEGWVRSAGRADLGVSARQFIEPFQKFQDQNVRTTADWKAFKVQFTPTQDFAADLVLSISTGGAVDIAGVTIRGE